MPVFLLLLFTLAISGCIQLGGEEKPAKYGKGLIITRFKAYPSTIYSKERVDLVLDVQNKGGRIAETVQAEVFSLGGMTDGGVEPLGDLEPPTEDFEGETATTTWSPEAPYIPQGIKDTVNPQVRVYYLYSTVSRVSVPVLKRSEWKRRVRRNEELPSLPATTVSNGPLSVEINARSPAMVKNEENEREFRLTVNVNNLISGTVYYNESHSNIDDGGLTSDDFDVLNITIKTGKGNIICGDENTYTDNEYTSGDELREGKRLRKSCSVQLSSGEIKESIDVPISVTLDYGYFITGSTSVTIKGE